MGLVTTLQGMVVGERRQIARLAQHEAARRLTPAERAERASFASEMRADPDGELILLGRWPVGGEDSGWIGLLPERLFTRHAWITGATGSGKSFFVLGVLLQVLKHARETVVVVDFKGELSQILRETVLPALAMLPGGEGIADELRVIRPFDKSRVPALRITAPEDGVSREVQAHAIASCVEDALGEALGSRMNRIFLKLTSLAIELGRPLPEVLRWLENPLLLTRDARLSQDSRTRAYAAGSFTHENRQTLDALMSRLDTFFFLPETSAALSAPSCVSFQECLSSGVTIIDVGDPPAGAERVAKFWAGVLGGRLTRAILSREVTDRSRRAWVVWEEFQEALGGSQTEQFSRLLALARYKKVSLWFANQQPAQVAAAQPALVRALRTNAGLEAAFRCNLEDARALAHAMPLPAAGSATESRQTLLESLTRLPDRVYLLWLKQARFRAQKVRSPRLDLRQLTDAAQRCPRGTRERLLRGTVSFPRDPAPWASQENLENGSHGLWEGIDGPGSAGEDDSEALPFLG